MPRFDMNGRENMPLMQERVAYADVLRSLTDAQKESATLEGESRDIIAGRQADDAIPETEEGLPVSELGDV
ncbi:MAG: hypothetical protein ABJN72_13685 [Sulfitobacter sp.]